MRLICPACKTVYEAPDGAIPASGRMVRCSNCRAEWMARPRGTERPAPPRTPPPLAPTAAAPAPPPPSVAAPPPVAAPPAERIAADPAPADRAPADPAPTRATVEAPAASHPPADRPARPPETLIRSLETAEAPKAASGGRFMAGFATVTLIAVAAVAIYARHEDLAQAAPSLADPLGEYVVMVDRLRDAIAALRPGG